MRQPSIGWLEGRRRAGPWLSSGCSTEKNNVESGGYTETISGQRVMSLNPRRGKSRRRPVLWRRGFWLKKCPDVYKVNQVLNFFEVCGHSPPGMNRIAQEMVME